MGDMFDGESSTPTRRQMDRPNSRWTCPRMDSKPVGFGLCGAESEFDDLTYEPDPESPETE